MNDFDRRKNLLEILGIKSRTRTFTKIDTQPLQNQPKFIHPDGLLVKPTVGPNLPIVDNLTVEDNQRRRWLPISPTPTVEPVFRFGAPITLPVDSTEVQSLSNQKIQSPIEPATIKFQPLNIVPTISTDNILPEISGAPEPETDINQKEKEDLAYIERVITKLSPALQIKDQKIYPLSGNTIELDNEGVEYESFDLGDVGVRGVRMSEVNSPIIACGDATAILSFNIGEQRIRIALLADGTGSSTCGDIAAKIMTDYSLEHLAHMVADADQLSIQQLPELIAESIVAANAYFSSISQTTFRRAFENYLSKFGANPIQMQGALDDFDYKATGKPLAGMSRTTIASTTLLSLAVIDNPGDKSKPISSIYLPWGDGGCEVASSDFESQSLMENQYNSAAPPAIVHGDPVNAKERYLKAMQIDTFNRPSDSAVYFTFHSDAIDKYGLQHANRQDPKSLQELCAFAYEITKTPSPAMTLKKFFNKPQDDFTYLILEC